MKRVQSSRVGYFRTSGVSEHYVIGTPELGYSVLLREYGLDRAAIKKYDTGCNLLLVNSMNVTPFSGLTFKECVLNAIQAQGANNGA